MRRLAPLSVALLAAALTVAGCDKARTTPPNPSGPGGCLGCHGGASGDNSGAPPNDLAGTATGGAVGAHLEHLGKGVACEECHAVPARIAQPGHVTRADGTPDGDGRAELTWGARATNAGKVSASFSPGPAPGKGGTCSVYCHGASLGADGGSSSGASNGNVLVPGPAWGGPALNCGSCHGDATVNTSSPNTTGAPPSHAAGLQAADCANCHPDTVTPGGQLTTTGAHINGKVEANGCTGCHGDATRGEPTSQASWAPPRDTTNAITGARVGAHLRHVSGVRGLGSRLSNPFECSECHKVPNNGGPHGQPVIQWATGTNDIVKTGGANPSYAGGSCSATWCHGTSLPGGTNTTPAWNAAGTAQCGSCHFISSPPAPHPVTDKAGLAITAIAQCAQCHPVPTGVANDPGNLQHVNGRVDTDVHPPGYSNPATHGPQALQGLNGCKACHGPTFAGQGQAPSCTQCHAAAGHANWLTECTFCHGQGNRAADLAFPPVGSPVAGVNVYANQAAPPVGTQGELTASSPAVGAHVAHIQPSSSANGALAIQIQCTECHGAVLPTDEKHADGSVAIGWGALARARSAVPTPAAGNLLPSWETNPTCTNYCHGITLAGGGARVNPNWVAGAPEAACGTCHAARPGTWHPNNGTCGQCHSGYTATSVSVATHVDGVIDPPGTSCTSCHPSASSPPPWVATTGATAGVKVGAHQAHVSAGTLVAAGFGCPTCHVNPGSLRHGNDQVEINWTGVAVAAGVVPAPAAGVLPLAAWEAAPTCTNYCHGASLTAAGGANRAPSWTGGTAQVACGTCHAAPPPLSAVPGANHPQNSVCANCHGAGYALAGVTGAARATHVNGATTLVVGGCTACHGDRADTAVTLTTGTLKAAPGATNTVTSADTTGQTLAAAPGVGAHRAHLAGTTYRTQPLACSECHALPPTNADVAHATGAGTGGARATLAWGNLARGIGASFNNEVVAPAYAGSTSGISGATAGSCASTYCHGQFKNGGKATVAWTATGGLGCNSCHGAGTGAAATLPGGSHPQGTATCSTCHTTYTNTTVDKALHLNGTLEVSGMNCSTCHGDSARPPVNSALGFLDVSGAPLVQAAPPLDTTTAASGARVGAHLAHVNQGATAPALSSALRCNNCHVEPASAGPHGLGLVVWGSIATSGGAVPSYDLVNHTCSSTWCHGNFPGGNGVNTVAWGTGTPAKQGCTACHGDPPAHPHPQNLGCGACHTGYTGTSVAAATHVDGVVSKTTSGCTSCHGALPVAGVTLTNNLVAAAPGVTGTNTVDTTGQSAAASAGVGAHRAHLGAGTFGHVALACTQCHALPPSNADTGHATGGAGTGGARATLAWGATATGAVNAWSGAPVTPAYTGSTTFAGGTTGGTCSNTYCHGNFTNGKNTTVGWTTAGALDCNACHGAGTGATATLPVAPHPPGNSNCGLCHTGYTGTTANAAVHLNGRLEVATQSCSGCHGDPSRTVVASATDLDGQTPNQFLALAAPPVGVTAANQVGAHLAHLNQGASGAPLSNAQHCVACHVVPSSLTHSDSVTSVAFGDIAINAGASPTYDGATHGCSATYCHGQFPGGIQSNLVTWGTGSSAGTKLGCTACHTGPPPHPHPSNVACASCHPGYTATTVAAATHVDGAVNKATSGCTSCHGELPAAGVTLTVNTVAAAPGATGTNTVDTAGLSGAATSAGTGAHRAHLAGTTYRAALACAECHALPPTNADTSHATGGAGTGGARATLTWGTLARGVGAAFNNELVAPAYAGSSTFAGGNAAGTCSGTYCHGQFKNGRKASVTWTAAPGLTCNSCHGAGAGATATLPGGSHPQGSAACGTCHAGYTGTTVSATNHLNGQLDIVPMTCTTCHGDGARTPVATASDLDALGGSLVRASPPVDSANLSAGNQVGAHLAHVNQGDAPALSNALRCVNCHSGLVWTTAPHGTPPGGNPVAFGNLATARGALPTAYSEASRTCSNTYCHGQFPYGQNGKTVGWGAGTLAKLACNACHGATSPQPGYPHPQSTACGSCHAGYSVSSVTAATHVDGLTTRATSGCTSCHGELPLAGVTLTNALASAAPGATGTNTVDSTGQAATTAAGVGVHRVHLTAGTIRSALACTECHALPPTDADVAHATGAGTGGARATLAFGPLATRSTNSWSGAPVSPTYAGSTTASGGTAGGTCAATYCHGNFTNGAAASPAWTAAATITCNSCHGRTAGATASPPGGTHPNNPACGNCHTGYTGTTANLAVHLDGKLDVVPQTCTSCHGDALRSPVATATDLDALGARLVLAAPPADSASLATGNQVGAHLSHVNQGATAPALSSALRCVNCHSGLVPTVAPHAPAANPVAFGNLATARGAGLAAYAANRNCSNTYCHGNFPTYGLGANSVNWGTTSPGTKLTCTQCHVNPVTAPTWPHPGNTVSACGTCHGAGYTATAVTAATHVDGLTTRITFGCSACHGVLATASPGVLAASPTLSAPGAGGNGLATTGAPVAATTVEYGAHQAHLQQATYRAASIACADCHVVPADGNTAHATGAGTGGARATLTWSALARGAVNTVWTTAVVPSYSRTGTVGCTATYCHGNFTNGKGAITMVWAQNAALDCNSCHGRGAGATATPPGGTHPNIAACGNCHTGYGATTVVPATHIDGQLQVVAQTCTSCHGDALRTPAATATDLDALGARLVLAAPPADSASLATGNQVGAHLMHVNQGASPPALSNALRCVNCHSGLVPTTAPHAAPASPVAFGNLATVGGNTAAYDTTSRNCSNTYCHGQFTGGRTGNTVNWGTGTPAKLDCAGCHGASAANPQPAHPHPQNTTCASCHTGYTVSAVAAATHVDGLVSKSTAGCTSCHGDKADTAVTLTVNTIKASPMGAPNSATSWDTTGQTAITAGGVGAHKAHLVGDNSVTANTPRWADTANACTECHALPPLNTNVSHGAGTTGTGGARANIIWGTLATGAVNSWSGVPVTPSYAGSNTFAGGTTGGTCSNTYCHGNFTNGARLTMTWTDGATTAAQCGTCHGLPPAGTHPGGVTECGSCHPGYITTGLPTTASTITAVNTLSHINGKLDGGGDCTGCHLGPKLITKGPLNGSGRSRRAIVPEFQTAGNWSHKRSGAYTVTKFDCVVCHMEGDSSGGTTGVHMDGYVDLRDADSGTQITYANWGGTGAGAYTSNATVARFDQFSRNLGSNVLEAPVVAIMINHCLKCHDGNGAVSTAARVSGAPAEKPFNTTIAGTNYIGVGITAGGVSGGVVNVNESFKVTNSSYHPVLGKQNNSYTQGTRMVAPWTTAKTNATSNQWGNLISCWDCHAPPAATGVQTFTVTAHGVAAANYMRGMAYAGTPGVPATGTPTSANSGSTLCNKCHAMYNTCGTAADQCATFQGHGTGSAFSSNTGRTTKTPYFQYGCNMCHSSGYTTAVQRPIRAQDTHGVNAIVGSGTLTGRWSTGPDKRPYAFIRNINQLADHSPKQIGSTVIAAGSIGCDMRTAPCSQGLKTYTVGGIY